jgi:hypothetical protein
MHRYLLFTFLMACNMSSNEQKKYVSKAGELKEADCYTDRKTIQTIDKKEGEVFLLDSVNFGIRYKEDSRPLLPCNLPGALQKAGKKIIFSGNIKATGPEELWAAEPFVLTVAREK